ncbi:response regulator transcription factor [Alcanivorax quisquiliarum]|uniref:Response regulator transcription factor n=1 Tax=Alcanivorax quisquiliarum TaxID=2933565 RepID=A0ABT0E6K4_9GAMM|nr:response regulator transcription factor [Alcanivorax quisquiliarum]MCK0537454.1 response regulator transcription factor [Alcanivorax quisquiliarum]
MTSASLFNSDFPRPAPVLVVEDEPLMQQRLFRILQDLGYDGSAIEIATTVAAARKHIHERPVSMALVDLGLPDGTGFELIDLLRSRDANLCILVISAWSTEEHIVAALRAGATGYVLKDRDDLEISLSIRSVLRGGAPIDPFVARRILELLPIARPERARESEGEGVKLSARETEILHLVAEGLTNREIAAQLFISRHTAECHIKNIYRKLAVSSRTRAINEARQRGLLP